MRYNQFYSVMVDSDFVDQIMRLTKCSEKHCRNKVTFMSKKYVVRYMLYTVVLALVPPKF